ncbi:MAG: putative Ig domain-containing protein [Calditrichia bacterium]
MRTLFPRQLKAVLFCLILSILPIESVLAQKAVAELISTMSPAAGEIKYNDGIRQIRFLNNHLLITNFWAGLQVVDVTDIRNPIQVASMATDDQAYYTDVDGDYAYLANQSSGVQVYNIADLTNVSKVAQIKPPGNAYWVVAEHPHLYVALGNEGFAILDVSDFDNPITVKLEIPEAWVQQIFKKDNLLFIAAKKGGMLIYDISDLENPVRLSQYRTGYNAMKVQVVDETAFVADGAGGLLLIDISNPEFPLEIKRFSNVGFVGDLYKAGNYVYLANRDVGLQIINVTDPKRPFLESRYATDDISYGVYKQDIYVFLAANTSTLIMRHNNSPRLTDIVNPQLYEDQVFELQLDAQEPDGDPVKYEIINMPEGATFSDESGAFSWTPTFEQSGEYRDVIYRVIEQTETSLSASDTVTLFVNHVNRLPDLPGIDNQQVDENKELSFVIPQGSDPDREDQERLAYRAENFPEGATFQPTTRTFSWTPTFEQSGSYVVDFVMDDGGGGQDREPITIEVNHIDRKPVIAAVNAQTVDEAQTLGIGITGTELDAEDKDKISFRMYNMPEGATFDPVSATFEWNPTYDQSGSYPNIMAVMISGALSDTTYFPIDVKHINRKPVLNTVATQVVNENEQLTFSVSGDDPDVEDNGKIVYAASNLPEGATFDPVTRTFSWTPTFEQSAVYDNVVFTLTDPDGYSDSKTTSIRATHVNRAPVISKITPQTIDENNDLKITLEASDKDREDKDKLRFSMQNAPNGATLDSKSGAFSWTPTYDQSGSYRVLYTVSDGEYTDTTSLPVTVNHVNRAPTLDDIANQTTDENQEVRFTINGSDSDTEDTGALTFGASGLPEGATFNPTSRVFNWTPTFEQSGSYEILFNVSDSANLSDAKTVVLDVTHVNRTPTLDLIEDITRNENEAITFQLTATDPDVENANTLSYEIDNMPDGMALNGTSGSVSWTPTYDQSGNFALTARVKDGSGLLAERGFTISVANVNRAPAFGVAAAQPGSENVALEFSVPALDPDSEDVNKLLYAAEDLPQGAILNSSNGTISWTPTYEQSGNYTVKLKVTDSFGETDETSVDINIVHVNRSPEVSTLNNITMVENQEFTLALPAASDPDTEDAETLEYRLTGLPSGAAFDNTSRELSWTPGFSDAGEYPIQYVVSDGNAEVTSDFNLLVTNVNRAPEISLPDDQSVREGETLSFSIETSDLDTEDNGNLMVTANNLPQGATFDNASKQFAWTPDSLQQGNYSLTFVVSDLNGLQANASLAITVEDVKPEPIVAPEPEPAPTDSLR